MSKILDEQAREIMRSNDQGNYTMPTQGLYPYQWNWDSAFASFGFATFDLSRAWVEIDTLFLGQWDNGMLPHIIFHLSSDEYFPGPNTWKSGQSPATSGISQPPVAATFVRKIYESYPAVGHQHITRLFPKLMAWHRWFFEHRNEGGMIVVNHPWESGRDNAPDWDEAMSNVDTSSVGTYKRNDTSHVDASMRPSKADYDRFMAIVYEGRDCGWDEGHMKKYGPFRVADPGMTFILLRANRDLLELAKILGENTAEIQGWIDVIELGVEKLWNPKILAYDAVNIRTGNFANSLSSASFLNWYALVENDKALVEFDRISAASKFGFPSYDPESERFEPFRYWRGPVWGVVNMLMGIGLAEMGHTEQAEVLRKSTAELIALSGFAEYFNPMDGSPAGGKDFTWTAAIWLAWASPTLQAKGK